MATSSLYRGYSRFLASEDNLQQFRHTVDKALLAGEDGVAGLWLYDGNE